MPTRPKRICTYPGCSRLTTDGRCERHPKQQWAKRADAPARVSGRRLQRLRAELFSANPLCVRCQASGIVRPATERDHVIPLAEGGSDGPDNVQGLCTDHHREKSLAEALRGRRGA